MSPQNLKTLTRIAVAILMAALFLSWIPFSEREVATQRLEQEILRSEEIRGKVSTLCKELLTNENTPLERWFISKIPSGNAVQSAPSLPSCILKAESTHSFHFNLMAQWSLGFQIFTPPSSTPILTQTFSTQFPLPLSFLPLLTFVFLIPFNISITESLVALGFHLLFLFGLNLIQAIKSFPKTMIGIITTDRLFPGLLLFSLWLSIRPLSERKQVRHATNSLEALLNSFFSSLIGIWNPILYSLLGPLLLPSGKEIKKITNLLNIQLLVLTLSLFTFGLNLSNLDSVIKSFFSPRYFSLSILFCFFFFLIPKPPYSQPLIWKFKHFRIYIASAVTVQILGLFFPDLKAISSLTQFGLLFVLIEIFSSPLDPWKTIFSRWKWPLSALMLSSLVAAYSSDSGAVDLIISICDPKKHPTVFLPFALLSGFLVGFVTGGFATPFFALVSQLVQSYPSPLIRAALFDGILAGLLLSPFSLFNLYPAFQNKVPIQKILRLRSKQVLVPLLMGAIVYLVGTVTQLRILPSVCFVFCCLAALTLKLKKNRWKLEWGPAIEQSEPR